MKSKRQAVYTLVVQAGRKADDGLPEGATGAVFLCYSSGVDEAEAVREAVAVFKQAGIAPLDVVSHGTAEEQERGGREIDPEEHALMQQALDENAVVVSQMTPLFEES